MDNVNTIQGLVEVALKLFETVYNGFSDVIVWLNKPIGEVIAEPLELLPDGLQWLEWVTAFLTNQFFQNHSTLDLMFATMGILLGTLIMVWILNWLPIF